MASSQQARRGEEGQRGRRKRAGRTQRGSCASRRNNRAGDGDFARHPLLAEARSLLAKLETSPLSACMHVPEELLQRMYALREACNKVHSEPEVEMSLESAASVKAPVVANAESKRTGLLEGLQDLSDEEFEDDAKLAAKVRAQWRNRGRGGGRDASVERGDHHRSPRLRNSPAAGSTR